MEKPQQQTLEMVELTLGNLPRLDEGRAAIAWQQQLLRVVQDIQDRPGNKRARTVVMECECTPDLDDDGELIGTEFKFKVKSSVPDQKTRTYHGRLSRNGQLQFNANAAESPDQRTMFSGEEEEGAAEQSPSVPMAKAGG